MTFVTKGNKLFYAASAVFNYPEWVIRVYVRFCRPLSVQVRYFFGGYVPPGTPNWHPVLKENSPKTGTPF